ncbi:MAG: hypothetical protein ACI82F_000830 [Planctomycetota bacterium]|jgi:hypothetical protein
MGLCLLGPQSTPAERQESGFMTSDCPLESAALRARGGELVLALHTMGLTPLSAKSARGFSSGPEVECQLGAWIGWRERWGIGL